MNNGWSHDMSREEVDAGDDDAPGEYSAEFWMRLKEALKPRAEKVNNEEGRE